MSRTMTTLLNKTIRLFLDSIGRRDEYEFYLSKFTTIDGSTFALICPDADDIDSTAQALAFDLNTLARLELFPALLLAGNEVQRMKMCILNTDHKFDVHAVEDFSSASIAAAEAFVRACAAQRTTGILTTQGIPLADSIQALIPNITSRVHALRSAGPLRAADGAARNYIYMSDSPAATLLADDVSTAQIGIQVMQAHPGAHVSICAPWQLLQELFTVKGAGTVVRRRSEIEIVDGPNALDVERLMDLLKEAFGREPIAERIIPNIQRAHIEKNYRGAALVETHPAGAYLSKFAVGTQARGEGLSIELWRSVTAQHPALFWRSRLNNPINHWYDRHAQGHHDSGNWRVFWHGVAVADLPDVINHCVQRTSDFVS
ncbi:MAG: acetylglutamate synthase [Kiritimatiellia bacterium]|jgi:acetylglutamate synthase